MKFDEAIKLQNFGEHYSIILGNVSIANTELGRVLEEKTKQEISISNANKEFARLGNEIERLSSIRDQVVKETDARIKNADDKERYLVKLTDDTNKYVSNYKIELEQVKSRLTSDIEELKDIFAGMDSQKDVMDKSIVVLSKQVSALSNSAKELSSEVQSLNKEKGMIIQDIDKYFIEHKKSTDRKSRELDSIEKRIAESESKVLDADNHFKQKEKDIARRENDVLIITKRLHALFQEVKPGIALKI